MAPHTSPTPMSLHLLSLSRRFVTDLPHHAVAVPLLLLPPVPTSPSITLCASVYTLCLGVPVLLGPCALMPLPAFCPSSHCSVLLQEIWRPRAEEEGVGNPLPTPLSLTQLKIWVWGRGTSQNKPNSPPQRRVLGVCFEGKSQKRSLIF